MRYLIILMAAFALVLGACEADDGTSPTPSPTGTLDLFGSPSPTADGTIDASPTESPDSTPSPSPTESPDGIGGASPTESPEETDGLAASPTTSPDDDGGGLAGADCEGAFEDVPDLSRIDSLQEFQEALDAIDQTIEACESVDEWTENAEQQLGLANLSLDAEQFLRDRCEESDDLSDTELCEEAA